MFGVAIVAATTTNHLKNVECLMVVPVGELTTYPTPLAVEGTLRWLMSARYDRVLPSVELLSFIKEPAPWLMDRGASVTKPVVRGTKAHRAQSDKRDFMAIDTAVCPARKLEGLSYL